MVAVFKGFQLDMELKKKISKPIGKLINSKDLKKTIPQESFLVCVGDAVSEEAIKKRLKPNIIIIDGKTERKKYKQKIPGKFIELNSFNPSSRITIKAWSAVKQSFCYSRPVRLTIKGEEDLLGLATCFFAPMNSFLIYGQRNQGIVVVKITNKIKNKIQKYLKKTFYNTAIIGGTWDLLHTGHRFLLLTAFELGKKVMIGVTSDKFTTSQGKKTKQSYKKRKKELENFLDKFGLSKRTHIFKLDDPFGKAISHGDILITGSDTYKRALKLNNHRKKPIKIVKISRVLAEDKKTLSSTRIRAKKIIVEGKVVNA